MLRISILWFGSLLLDNIVYYSVVVATIATDTTQLQRHVKKGHEPKEGREKNHKKTNMVVSGRDRTTKLQT